MTSADYRKFKRYRSKFPIRFALAGEVSLKGFDQLGYMVNISKSGLQMVSSELLQFGETYSLSFRLPCNEKILNVKISGVVRWSKKKSDNDLRKDFEDFPFYSGLQFSKSDERPKIEEFLIYWESLSSGLDF